MASNEKVRVEIGFDSGQVLSSSITTNAYDELAGALRGSGSQVVELETDEGRHLVAVSKIAYVKRFSRESPVGFGKS